MPYIKKILADKRGGTVLFMTMMLLFGILTVTLAVSDIIQNIMKVGRSQADSTLAFFAAEAGAERILHEIRNNSFNTSACLSPNKFCFDSNNSDNTLINCSTSCGVGQFATTTLSNGAEYYINYNYAAPTTTISCIGQFKEMRRKVDLIY